METRATPETTLTPDEVRESVREAVGEEEGTVAEFTLKTMTMIMEDSEGTFRYLSREMRRLAPRTVFALVPFFALLLRVLYHRSGRYYVEHFIFALHLRAFVFALLIATLLIPGAWAGQILFIWALIYTFLALRKVYGGSRFVTALKFTVLVGGYTIVQSLALTALVITLILRAQAS